MKAKRRFNIRRCRLMTNEPLPVLIAQAQALLARVAAHPDHKQLLALGWSPDLYIADAQTALTYLDWEIKPESEAIAPAGKLGDRPTLVCISRRKTICTKGS